MDYPGPEGCLYDGECYLCEISGDFVLKARAGLERQFVKVKRIGFPAFFDTLPTPESEAI